MPDETCSKPEISRLSFRPDRYSTALLNGQPLAQYFRTKTGPKRLDQLVFPVCTHCEEDQVTALERLIGLAGWTPILVDDYYRTLGDGAVVFAWAEEQDGLVVWSRFVCGRHGESGPVEPIPLEVAPLTFDRDEYLGFIKEVDGLALAEGLISGFGSILPRSDDAEAELKAYGPKAAFQSLARLVFDSGEMLRYRQNSIIERLLTGALLLILGLSIGLIFDYEETGSVSAFLVLALAAVLVGTAKLGCISGFFVRRFASDGSRLNPPVYLDLEGFRIEGGQELIPWQVFDGYEPDSEKTAAPWATIKSTISIAKDGRIIFIPGTLWSNGQINPDLSLINARLSALIESRKPCPPTPLRS